jgi:hypothetical protein
VSRKSSKTSIRQGLLVGFVLLSMGCTTASPPAVDAVQPTERSAAAGVPPLDEELRALLPSAIVFVRVKPPVDAARWRPPTAPTPMSPGEELLLKSVGLLLIPVVPLVMAAEAAAEHPSALVATIGALDLGTTTADAFARATAVLGVTSPIVCPADETLAACLRQHRSEAEALILLIVQAQYLGRSPERPRGALALSMAPQVMPLKDGRMGRIGYQHHWRWRVPTPRAIAADSEALRSAVDQGLQALAMTLVADLWQRDEPEVLPLDVIERAPGRQIAGQEPATVQPAERWPLWLTVAE